MIELHDVEQGSEEWQQARDGKITGTSAHKLLRFGLIEYSRTTAGGFGGNFYTKRGHLLEAEALELYETITGSSVSHTGFVTNSLYPDCLFSPDGLTATHVLEVKCFNADKHREIAKNGAPLTILAQIHFGMLITERQAATLIIYNPDLPAAEAFKMLNIPYDQKIQDNFKRKLAGVTV